MTISSIALNLSSMYNTFSRFSYKLIKLVWCTYHKLIFISIGIIRWGRWTHGAFETWHSMLWGLILPLLNLMLMIDSNRLIYTTFEVLVLLLDLRVITDFCFCTLLRYDHRGCHHFSYDTIVTQFLLSLGK